MKHLLFCQMVTRSSTRKGSFYEKNPKTSEAQKRATKYYEKEKIDKVTLRLKKVKKKYIKAKLKKELCLWMPL